MAKTVRTKNGFTFTYLSPAEKGAKYAQELRTGKKYTNDGQVKKDKNGKALKLKVKERAYRGGYLDARNDNSKAFNAKRS